MMYCVSYYIGDQFEDLILFEFLLTTKFGDSVGHFVIYAMNS